MVGYLTPDDLPADTICRVLFIPNSREWLANVTGALETLTIAANFTLFGAITPDVTAEVNQAMFDRFCFNEGACRVIGEIVIYASSTSPDPARWLACDGSSYLRTDYPGLFALVGTAFGAADSTHFNVPDLRGRTVVGAGAGAGLTPRALGDSFGEEIHQLIVSETPSHSHTDTGHSHVEGIAAPNVTTIGPGAPEPTAIPAVGATGTGFANLTSTGGDGAHNNMQPSLAIYSYIVASE